MSERTAGQPKSVRQLTMFERLNRGDLLYKKELIKEFCMDEKTIQRDIEDLRIYFENFYEEGGIVGIQYDRKKKGYYLEKNSRCWLTNDEVLGLAKILLESRAFVFTEMKLLLDKLILQAIPEQRKYIKETIGNEQFHYVPLQHQRPLLKSIWELSGAIREKQKIKIHYTRANETSTVERVIKPVGIIFAEYYFYLIAYIEGYDLVFPAIYRIDRMSRYEIQEEKFHIPNERFEEGEFRKRIQFMSTGELLKVRFKFWGTSLEAVLDRLPNSEIIEREGNKTIIEAKVFGKGIKMWFLSQAQYLEVIEPVEFREEMKKTLEEMRKLYG